MVVALALAAVIGAVSLANPAMAAVGQPGDAELTERTFAPQAVPEDLKAQAGDGSATLTWTKATTDTRFRIRHAIDADQIYTVLGPTDYAAGTAGADCTTDGSDNSCSFLVENLTNGSEHVFQVQSARATGGFSAFATAKATPNSAPTGTATITEAEGGAGTLEITWTWTPASGSVAVDGWQYQIGTAGDWMDMEDASGSTRTYTITGLDAGASVTAQVRPLANGVAGTASADSTADAVTQSLMAALTPSSFKPGSNARYKIVFTAPGAADAVYRSTVDDIVITLEDFNVPSSISTDDVTVSVTDAGDSSVTTNTAASVAVDGAEITIGLRIGADDFLDTISGTDEITVILRQSAGISNPSEGKSYGGRGGDLEVKFGDASAQKVEAVAILRTLSLDPEDGGRGEMVEATGKGFKSGTTLQVFLDRNENNRFDAGDLVLCRGLISGDEVATCNFEATNPPLESGVNRISAVDGRSQFASEDQWGTYELTPSLSATPEGGTPGETILIQLTDFTPGSGITRVRLARQDVCNDDANATNPLGMDVPECSDVVKQTGDVDFQIVIPDWAPAGREDLRVDVGSGADAQDASTVVTITGPVVTSTPSTVVANQRISLVGDGFTDGGTIARISIGGQPIDPTRYNGGQPVRIDNGGGWSASVNLPLVEATTSEGVRQIVVTDSSGRSGGINVTIPARKVTISPDSGRVGTLATVRGENFPSRNDDGNSFNVSIVYDSGENETTFSPVVDASGKFEAPLRIPTTADIPSTNTVRVEFDDADRQRVITTVTHSVPEGGISLSATSGSPGTVIGVTGEGFKAFVPVQSVHVGSIEVTPSPAPSTNDQGMLDFEITIPGLDNGIQTVEVEVSGTTASVGFTVMPSGVAAGDITASAKAVENLGENFVIAWNFNNDTKTWSFYDGEEGSDLDNFITGETYLILITSDIEAILNNRTRNLTCVGGNCWNVVVW